MAPVAALPQTTQARTVLQQILRRRLTLTSQVNEVSGEVDGHDFEGPRWDKLFTGIAVEGPTWIADGDRTGREDIGPEDTFQATTAVARSGLRERGGVPSGCRALLFTGDPSLAPATPSRSVKQSPLAASLIRT